MEKNKITVPGLKVLMYHRIVEDKTPAGTSPFCIHKEEFRKQLAFLKELGYTPITFNEYYHFINGTGTLPDKPVIITFDDGYLDTYEIAFPLLKHHNMKAVIFVLGDRSMKTNTWDAGKRQIPEAPLMEDHHIRELHTNGFEIGAHSLTHPDLQMLPVSGIYRELKVSKDTLEALTESPVNTFSNPYGSVNPIIKNLAVKAGYRFACGVYTGPALFGKDLMEIRRIAIFNHTSITQFNILLNLPVEYFKWIWWKILNLKKQKKSNAGQPPLYSNGDIPARHDLIR